VSADDLARESKFQWLARFGFVTRGLLYIVIALLVIGTGRTEDLTGAMAALASLRKPIDAFFDHVTVNDPDSAKRERRLNLLMRFRDAVNCVADFSEIEG